MRTKNYLNKKLFFIFFILSSFVYAQSSITVTVKAGQTIRSIAKDYLGDSNLWEDILRANNFSSPADIKLGTKLTIPVQSIKQNQEALISANDAINEASKAGARLFAETLIDHATSLYEEALNKRKTGLREESTKLAKQSKDEADKAIIESQKKSNTSSPALLSYRKGNVENKKPSELTWNNAELYSQLFEQYRTRTLSNSYAEISFKDLSRIRLYENSQAVVQSSRVDLLKNRKKATVNLEKGEAYALLLGNSDRKEFNLEIPGLDTKINSKFFWVQKEVKDTKIANYNGEIEVTSRDSMVVIRENQGSVVPAGGVPSKPKTLLPTPVLLYPEFQKTFFSSNVEFEWQNVEGADKYFLTVSNDQSFETVVESKKDLQSLKYEVNNLKPGSYYWRVAAIDEIGFPGPFSSIGNFIVKIDTYPPFLTLTAPGDSAIFKENKIEVSGSTESDALITINDSRLEVKKDGTFKHNIELTDGTNHITVKAQDPAGNESLIERTVYYEGSGDVKINFMKELEMDSEGNLYIETYPFTLKGNTKRKSLVTLNYDQTFIQTYADEKGGFQFTINETPSEGVIKVLVKTPAGNEISKLIKITRESFSPVVTLDPPLPQRIAKGTVEVSGKASKTDRLKINGTDVELTGGEFNYELSLLKGTNQVVIEAANRRGKKQIIERNIFFDNEAPLLISKIAEKQDMDKIEVIKITVTAKDDSYLKRTAEINYSLNGKPNKTFIKLIDDNGTYEGTITIDADKKDTFIINNVILEDYLGNIKKYAF